MPILSIVGRNNWSNRLFACFLYVTLTLFGLTMAAPFLITLTSSGSNNFDYDRFSILPRALWSKEDRFVKGIVPFVNGYPGWFAVLQNEFPNAPATWTSWRAIGLDNTGVDRLAGEYLHADSALLKQWKLQAADYCEFSLGYPVEDTLATFTNEQAAEFIALRHERLWAAQNPQAAAKAGSSERHRNALEHLSQQWGVPIESFFAINFDPERRAPLVQQSWLPPQTPKQSDFNALRFALLHGDGVPGVESAWKKFLRAHGYSGKQARDLTPLPQEASQELRQLWLTFARESMPASPAIPFPLRQAWFDFLGSDETRGLLKLKASEVFDAALYNKLAATNYARLKETPFPLPHDGFGGLQPLWDHFVETRYPLRLTRLTATPQLQERYQQFLQQRYLNLENANRLLHTASTAWSDFSLASSVPAEAAPRQVWVDFVKSLPAGERLLSSSEAAYQQFLLTRYGSLEAINTAYGWNLHWIEEAAIPFDKAYAVTYLNHSSAFAWSPLLSNYRTIGRFLISQGNAIPVTLWLIALSIFMTLTVNPIAGYALSRFNLRNKDKIILFCLATSAFPAMVSAIPGYLLMRDLGLLNTFLALILPGAANGMSIFILKGFFDSLPQELYEAATIDGAKEWQIFSFITLPMIKPILAVNALNAFIGAYSGWQWALIICQKKSMWTLSVWLYQASQWWGASPWITTAGFVIASIPTLIVFLLCQNVIMRGIVVPSMK